ncbi:MAG: diguanylate cyclase [Acidobacteria bacterium]|nr:diguanylate cyclase [Acidobacteriota bacterium]
MELGTLQIQIFVSLVVVLGTAFVAFLCDFLKGNNEQLRERNIEMQVRQEEQRRFGVWEPAKLLKGIEALLKNTPAVQYGAPPEVAPVEAPLEPVQTPSWEQPAEPAAVKSGTWASKEELEKLAERAARIRERHEARKAAEETSETEKVAPVMLPVALASISGISEAEPIPEAAPERVEEAQAAAETPPLAAETESVEQESQAASAQSEAGGILEGVTAEAEPAEGVAAEGQAQAEAAVECVEAVPEAVTEAEPDAVEAEPVAPEAEPVAVEAEPVALEAEPVAVEAEPVALEAEPAALEAEAAEMVTETPAGEAEADGPEEWAGEPVAGLQLALPHEIPQVAEPQLAELARVDEEAILAAQEAVRLPGGELPLAPIAAVEDAAGALVAEAVDEPAEELVEAPLAAETAEGEGGGEPEFLRVRVLPIDQPVKEETEEVAGAELEVDGRRLIAAPESEAPESEPMQAAAETEAPELTTEPAAAAETIEAGAEITSLHESLAKEEPGLPAGLHDVTLLRERMKANLNFEGVAVSIGINDYDALRQKLDTSAGAESMASVERLIQSMLKGSDFACRFQEDEFILLFPGEADSSAQRRLFQISEKLWDFQLRSLGHQSIMFSWGGLEVKRDTLSDAVASARERMFQTKRNRTGAIEMRKRVVNG